MLFRRANYLPAAPGGRSGSPTAPTVDGKRRLHSQVRSHTLSTPSPASPSRPHAPHPSQARLRKLWLTLAQAGTLGISRSLACGFPTSCGNRITFLTRSLKLLTSSLSCLWVRSPACQQALWPGHHPSWSSQLPPTLPIFLTLPMTGKPAQLWRSTGLPRIPFPCLTGTPTAQWGADHYAEC